nr:ORF54 [Bracoviriform inaniti]
MTAIKERQKVRRAVWDPNLRPLKSNAGIYVAIRMCQIPIKKYVSLTRLYSLVKFCVEQTLHFN